MRCYCILIALSLFTILSGRCVQADRWSQMSRRPPTDWRWTNEKWTGDDRPYATIRSRIKQSIAKASGQRLTDLVESYKKMADANPFDPQAQFAWGYALLDARNKDYILTWQTRNEIIQALANAKSPHTSEYARLRFRATMRLGLYLQLQNLGKRLIHKNPQDDEVKSDLVKILASGPASEKKQALLYAQDLVRKRPAWAGSYNSLGTAYQEIFFDNRDLSIGDKAIEAYRNYLRLMPSTSPYQQSRSDAEYLIKLIRKRQKKWAKKGA